MNRQECEYLIGCLLEDIRRVVRLYDESIDHVSMHISDYTSSAVALSDEDENGSTEYLLKVDVMQEGEEA